MVQLIPALPVTPNRLGLYSKLTEPVYDFGRYLAGGGICPIFGPGSEPEGPFLRGRQPARVSETVVELSDVRFYSVKVLLVNLIQASEEFT